MISPKINKIINVVAIVIFALFLYIFISASKEPAGNYIIIAEKMPITAEWTKGSIVNQYNCSGTTMYDLAATKDGKTLLDNTKLAWEVDNPKIASIDESGVVFMKDVGEVTVRVSEKNEDKYGTIKISSTNNGYDYISSKDLSEKIKNKENVLVIDLRTPKAYQEKTIPGAVNATTITDAPWDPLNAEPCFQKDEVAAANLKKALEGKNADEIVFCCPGGGGGAENAIRVIREFNILDIDENNVTPNGHISILKGGLINWFEEDMPVSRG